LENAITLIRPSIRCGMTPPRWASGWCYPRRTRKRRARRGRTAPRAGMPAARGSGRRRRRLAAGKTGEGGRSLCVDRGHPRPLLAARTCGCYLPRHDP
jgi:hypothetical protein